MDEQQSSRSSGFRWIRKLHGLVRTPAIDHGAKWAFVATFEEKLRTYKIGAYALTDGSIVWESRVDGGGYGAPMLTGSSVIVPSRFTGIVALNKKNGEYQWRHDGEGRVRSSAIENDGSIIYSSGGDLITVSASGQMLWKLRCGDGFLYGSPVIAGKTAYSLGSAQDGDGSAARFIFSWDLESGREGRIPVGPGNVVSSDSAGLLWHGNLAIVGVKNAVVAVDLFNGQTLWTCLVTGDASRHQCRRIGQRIFYTTLAGAVGAVDLDDGSLLWERLYIEPVLTPVSAVDDRSISFCADGYIYQLSVKDGLLLGANPIGHVPYSALNVSDACAVIGGGEPPYAGFLACLDHADGRLRGSRALAEVQTLAAEERYADVAFDLPVGFVSDSIQLYTEAVSTNIETRPWLVEKLRAHFRVEIDPQCVAGSYGLVLEFKMLSGENRFEVVLVELRSRTALPNCVLLTALDRIQQEEPIYSGAAAYQMLERYYGYPTTSQSERRKMVDWIRERSGYQPFDIWRIVLRRAVTGSATRVEDLPEFPASPGSLEESSPDT